MKFKIFVFLIMSILVVSCAPKTEMSALPTVVLNGASGTSVPVVISTRGLVAASGVIVAEQEAQMAFSVSGILETVNFAVGDQVKAGQVLAELDNTAIKLDLEQAQRNLKELSSAASQASAEQSLAEARQILKDQQDKVNALFYRRASDTLIKNTQGQIDLAKLALARASDSYRLVARREDGDNDKATALVAMTNAQLHLNELTSKINWYIGKPSEIDSALANAKMDVAKTAVQEAEWYLSELKGEKIPDGATGKQLAVIQSARTSVASAQDRLDHTFLISPISGIIVKTGGIAGETVSTGELLFLISDVNHLHVETTDLSERDVPSVAIGQKVDISIKALNTTVSGHVSQISPVADTLGGDVVYKTTIQFDSFPEGIRAGMSVDVQYDTSN